MFTSFSGKENNAALITHRKHCTSFEGSGKVKALTKFRVCLEDSEVIETMELRPTHSHRGGRMVATVVAR